MGDYLTVGRAHPAALNILSARARRHSVDITAMAHRTYPPEPACAPGRQPVVRHAPMRCPYCNAVTARGYGGALCVACGATRLWWPPDGAIVDARTTVGLS